MTPPLETGLGSIAGVWRYPVKSMIGEKLVSVEVGTQGLVGDRALALIDPVTGKVASAKNPRLWARLFEHHAVFLQPPVDEKSLPAIRIQLPSGKLLTTDQTDLEDQLSASLGRAVIVRRTSIEEVISEGYWPDYEWLARRDENFEFPLPQGTFFDGMPIHVVTTATLRFLQSAFPECSFDSARFRPNFVIESPEGVEGFVEEGWIGKTVAFGEVTLRIERPCPRCVMTTLHQGHLHKDPTILRAAVQQNAGNVGIYATVINGGKVHEGDHVQFA